LIVKVEPSAKIALEKSSNRFIPPDVPIDPVTPKSRMATIGSLDVPGEFMVPLLCGGSKVVTAPGRMPLKLLLLKADNVKLGTLVAVIATEFSAKLHPVISEVALLKPDLKTIPCLPSLILLLVKIIPDPVFTLIACHMVPHPNITEGIPAPSVPITPGKSRKVELLIFITAFGSIKYYNV
jgi:hypothetical protein